MAGLFFEVVDFRGRMDRGVYVRFLIFGFIAYVVMCILMMSGTVGAALHGDFPRLLFQVVRRSVILCLTVAWLSATFRRLHDTGRSGLWSVLIMPGWLAWQFHGLDVHSPARDLLPALVHRHLFDCLLAGCVSAAILLLFLVLPGTDGGNRYDDTARHTGTKGWQRVKLSDPDAPPHKPVFDFGAPAKRDTPDADDGPSGVGRGL